MSVSTIGTRDELSEQQLVEAVKAELAAWFDSSSVAGWQHLKTYRIPFAQPNQVGGRDPGAIQSGLQPVVTGSALMFGLLLVLRRCRPPISPGPLAWAVGCMCAGTTGTPPRSTAPFSRGA